MIKVHRLLVTASLLAAMAVPALAETPVNSPRVSDGGGAGFKLSPHHVDLDSIAVPLQALVGVKPGVSPTVAPSSPAAGTGGRLMTAADTPSADGLVAAGTGSVMDPAGDADVVGTTSVCGGYFQQSMALNGVLTQAYKAMGTKDLTTLYTLLPSLESALDALPASEIKAEVCDNDHVNAYTDYQYFEIATLRSAGITKGVGGALALVKQPELNQGPLAYAVGWIKYEQGDYEGALAAYKKGLVMVPHLHGLQTEYGAALLREKRAEEAVHFIDDTYETTLDLDDQMRASLFKIRGLALVMLGALDAAEESLDLSLRYVHDDETKLILDQIRTIRAQAKK